MLYDVVADTCNFPFAKPVLLVVENPRSSLLWSTSMRTRAKDICRFHVDFQNCAYGGARPKWTRLCCNDASFMSLARTCPGGHCLRNHKPWGLSASGGWSTAEETAYPHGLARAIAKCFASAVEVVPYADPSLIEVRARTMHQPTASLFGPLVPEHLEVRVLRAPPCILDRLPVPLMARLMQPWLPPDHATILAPVPAHAQLLRAHPITDKSGECLAELAWGIPHDEDQFLAKAVEVGHPRMLPALLPSVLEEAVDLNASASVQDLAALRMAWFGRWSSRAQELAPQEKELHRSLPSHRAAVLSGKRILLFRELLEHCNYPDPGVVSLLTDGVDLDGQVPVSGVFPPCFRPAERSPEDLVAEAPAIRDRILQEASQPSAHDSIIASKTLEEAQKGWVSEPLDPHTLEADALINRRFAILQQGKPRVIDDCSASGLNASVQKTESPKPQSTDLLGSLCAALLEKFPRDCDLEGKCVDLKSAYRQVPVSDSSLRHSNIAYFDPLTKGPIVRRMYALPFGASRAVYGYLRIAHSLWWLAVKCLALMTTHFFDDFVTICQAEESRLVSHVLNNFFGLLGWKVAEDKDKDFSSEFGALGVCVSFAHFSIGEVRFANTPGRVEELKQALEALLLDRRAPAKLQERLRGRMLYAGGQLFGRLAKLCVQALRSCEAAGGLVSEEAAQELCPKSLPSLCIFSLMRRTIEGLPGSQRCGMGGILFDSSSRPLKYFSLELTRTQRESLGEGHASSSIFEAELCAAILAMVLWREELCGRSVVCYVDNNSARDVLISGVARNRVAMALTKLYLTVESLSRCFPWFTRVPSPSNCADPHSREVITEWRGLRPTDHKEALSSILEVCPSGRAGIQ